MNLENLVSIGNKVTSKAMFLVRSFLRFYRSRFCFHEIEMQFLSALDTGSIDVALDVGAATGSYSWVLSRVSRQVYAFEPGKSHYGYLKKMAFGTNIEVINSAVGSTCARVKMFTPGENSCALHLATLSESNPVIEQNGTVTSEVEQIALDSFLAGKIEKRGIVDFLKIDVEGYELDVLKGASEVISNYHPLIYCEIEVRHNADYRKVFEYLIAEGYDCYIFRQGNFELFQDKNIEGMQKKNDLDVRLSGKYNPKLNMYINNFVFQHPLSRVKVRTE